MGTDLGHYKGYTEEDYRLLCETLSSIKGSYVLSGYSQNIEPTNYTEKVSKKTTMSVVKNKELDKAREEFLWIRDIDTHPLNQRL